jgi:hypothetical protein
MKVELRNMLLESLLTEKDNRGNIIKVYGVSQEVADWAHNLNDKFSMWIAGSLKDKYNSEMGRRSEEDRVSMEEYARGLSDNYEAIIRVIKTDNRPPMPKPRAELLSYDMGMDFLGKYRHIEAWLEDPLVDITAELGQGFLKNMTWDEALRMADEWHASLEAGGDVEDLLGPKDEVFHDFGNGWMWVMHKDWSCDASRKSMGHCAKASSRDMYLLRLVNGNREFVTVDWHPTGKYIIQIKGKGNKKPIPKLHKFIVWLITEWGGIKSIRSDEGYLPHTNFHLGDLEPELAAKIYTDNPSLIDVHTILKFMPENKKDKFIMTLFKDESFLGKLIPYRFSKFFELVENKDSVNGIIIKHPTFLQEMNEYTDLLAYTVNEMVEGSKYKDKLIEALLGKEGFLDMVDETLAEVLMKHHSDPDKVEEVIMDYEFGGDEEMDESLYLRESIIKGLRGLL